MGKFTYPTTPSKQREGVLIYTELGSRASVLNHHILPHFIIIIIINVSPSSFLYGSEILGWALNVVQTFRKFMSVRGLVLFRPRIFCGSSPGPQCSACSEFWFSPVLCGGSAQA